MTLWLVGAGPMAAAHAAVLSDLDQPFTVVGQSEERARSLAEAHGAAWIAGGVDKALRENPKPLRAVVALPINVSALATLALIEAGVKELLIEKPGAVTSAELKLIKAAADRHGTRIFVAFNRRFFAAVEEAKRRIDAAGGALSVFFEFTEASDRVIALPTDDAVKRRWALANSSHVIDLAFYLAGKPTTLSTGVSGSLPWHPEGAVFRGFGETEAGTQVSYIADWRGPGRWGLEVVLPDERLILRPIEKLQTVPRGRFDPIPVEIDDSADKTFKPGLLRQMEAFLNPKHTELPTLDEHLALVVDVVDPIAGYAPARHFDTRTKERAFTLVSSQILAERAAS